MKLILQLIFIVCSNPQPAETHLSPKGVICHPFPQAEQLPNLFSSRHIRNSLTVSLFLNSEPQLGKSKEFKNQGLKVNRNLNAIFFFGHQKAIKNRHALHENIRASSLSINSLELSFKSKYLTVVARKYKFHDKLQMIEDVLSSQNIDSGYFLLLCYHLPPLFPPSPLQSQVTMICNLLKCDDFTVL